MICAGGDVIGAGGGVIGAGGDVIGAGGDIIMLCLLFSLQTRMFQHTLFVWWAGSRGTRGVWRCSTGRLGHRLRRPLGLE